MLLLVFACARRLPPARRHLLRSLLAAVLAVAIASFAVNVILTNSEQAAAYYLTPTRVWELALGGVLALAVAGGWRPSRTLATLLGFGGLAAIGVSLAVLGSSTPYPGTAALLPTFGALAVIAAGGAGELTLASRALESAPARHVGRVSYALYLWHWPMIVFALALWGRLAQWQELLVVAAAYLPALGSHLLVERPLHHSARLAARPRLTLWLGAAGSGVAVGCALLLSVTVPQTPEASHPAGARAMLAGHPVERTAHALRPTPTAADGDTDAAYEEANCFVSLQGTSSPPCVFGDTSSKRNVVLFGDSHAMQYFPAIEQIAKRSHWRLTGLTKSACPPAEVHIYRESFGHEYGQCDEWRAEALRRIAALHPRLVIVSGDTRYHVSSGGRRLGKAQSVQRLIAGYERTLRTLVHDGARVVVIRDVPHLVHQVPPCVSRNLHHLERCATPRARALSYTPIGALAAHATRGARLLSPLRALCSASACPAVIGNEIVYRDGGHLTAAYARSMTRWLEGKLHRVAPL